MKRNLLLIAFILIVNMTQAQNSIPNGNFEDWTGGTYDYPQYYPYTSNRQAFLRFYAPFNEVRTTDAYHGNYAVEVSTLAAVGDTSGGYFVNSPNTDGDLWHGGIPYAEIPTGIRGYYKYNIATEDSGLVVAAFSKNAVSIGMYMYTLGGIHNSYAPFSFTFDPPLSQTPDSVIFGATSSDFMKDIYLPGSTLLIDSVSFTGVTGQPALLNGDFETWQSETIYKLDSWYLQEIGAERTSDAYRGNWAIELTTFVGNENSTTVARSGRASTGYYSNSCYCMKGGYPYSEMKDTLTFYYKYDPADISDMASVFFSFKKNGTQIGGWGDNLPAAADYTYHEIPFEMGIAPDSVMIELQSSLWSNTDLSFAGAVLKIDDIYFKSQMVTTDIKANEDNKKISIFPNPTGGILTVLMADNGLRQVNPSIDVFNGMGQKVFAAELSELRNEFDISGFPKGMYFIKISDGTVIHTEKIMKY